MLRRGVSSGWIVVLLMSLLVGYSLPAFGTNFGSAGTPGTAVNSNGVWLTETAS